MGKTPLRVLIVEDSEDDSVLILRELRRSGFAPASQRVETPEAMRLALSQQPWDVVISDYSMPRFSGLAALSTLRESDLDLPFIVVSGNIGEEVAVDAMKAGAHDYVMKENLARLGPAVQRELQEVQVRKAKEQAETRSTQLYKETRLQANKLAALLEIGSDISSTLDLAAVLRRIARHAGELLDVDETDIYFLDERNARLRPIVSLGNYEEETLALPLKMGEGIVGWIAQSGVAEVINHAERDPRAVQIPGTPVEPNALVCAPLIYGGHVRGVMSLGRTNPKKDFTQADLDFLVSLARQAAIAIENARLYADEQQRTEELARALEQQRDLDRLKDQFIQNVSHELRTPVTIIQGYAELLESGDLGHLLPEHKEPISIIARRAQSLRKLVDDLTTILQTQARGFGRLPVNLTKMVHDVMADFQPVAEQSGLRIAAYVEPGLPAFRGNYDYLRRMMDNLVDNAVKFTPPGGDVSIAVSHKARDLFIKVKDTGVGIPENQLERIFERFYQVDGGIARKYGGTGLGLALVKEIAASHDGRVTVRSQEGMGSEFCVQLPFKRSAG